MASPAPQTPKLGTPTGAVAVLSSDSDLLAAARRATGKEHELLAVSAEADLAAQLLTGKAGAVLIDSAAVTGSIDGFTERLRKQFPDLVLVVAGGPEDQGKLSKQITNGVVYRFLHRPVSEQRIRLFVEAALRRHDVEHAEHAAAPPAPLVEPAAQKPQRKSTPSLWYGLGAAILLVAAVAGYLATRPDDTRTVARTTPAEDAAAERAGRIATLLADGDSAYTKGDWATPEGVSAADKYQAVLALDPNNSRARAGLDLVLDKLLSGAENALLAEDVELAEQQVTAAARLSPGNSRAAFLTVQVRKERERGALTRARDSARSVPGSDQAAGFLRLANQRLRSGNLIEPAEDNARFYIEAARGLTPDDPAIPRLTRMLQSAMLDRARSAAGAGNSSDTEFWLANAQEAAASRTAITDVRRSLQQALVTNRADTITRATQSFNEAFAAGRLVAPSGDNAKTYFQSLAQADTSHPATVQARQTLGSELLREARIALGRNDLAGADQWLGHARDIGFNSDETARASRELAAARTRASNLAAGGSPVAATGDVVAASSLERTQYAAPRYPTKARENGTRGWVDIEFVVLPDGTVGNVAATQAEPVGVFEQAAINAVRRWRYRPVIRDGAPVEQRVKLRLRFELQD